MENKKEGGKKSLTWRVTIVGRKQANRGNFKLFHFNKEGKTLLDPSVKRKGLGKVPHGSFSKKILKS